MPDADGCTISINSCILIGNTENLPLAASFERMAIQITLSYNYAFIGFFVAWIKIPRNAAARIIPTG